MESIVRLLRELPEGYERAGYETNAITRCRGVKSAEDLMMLLMFHLVNGCTLVEISEIAETSKLGKMSDVAFMKRFAQCSEWFKWIAQKLIGNSTIECEIPLSFAGYTPIGVDGSDCVEKGRSGQEFHIHFALDIFNLCCAQYKITDQQAGETLLNFTPQKGWIMLGDRAYGTLAGIEHCVAHEADFVLRLRHGAFNLFNENGEKIDLLSELSDVTSVCAKDIDAYINLKHMKKFPVRICATKIPDERLPEVERKILKKSRRSQRYPSEEAKQLQNYVVVITALPKTISAGDIISLYRYRWQIELYFNRLKTILNIGDLPKKRRDSSLAWLNGKIMIALLIETLLAKAHFPPQD